jgi:hypothetical protein
LVLTKPEPIQPNGFANQFLVNHKGVVPDNGFHEEFVDWVTDFEGLLVDGFIGFGDLDGFLN